MNWKDDYIQFLGCVNPKDLKIESAMALKDANMPDRIYKYRPATEYAIANLENDTVWLSQPSEYNDPFEFAEFIDFNRLSPLLNKKHGFDVTKHFHEKYPLPEEIQIAANDSKNPMEIIADYVLTCEGRSRQEISAFKIALEQTISKYQGETQKWKTDFMQEQMKVCSFCESNNHLLMWGHYAANHTGFCVEYDIQRWDSEDIRRRILYPVIYQRHRYEATDHLIQGLNKKEGFNPLYAIICGSTKSAEWQYEKEWRLIVNLGDSFPQQNYRMECQSKVFLGCRIKEDQKSRILQICAKKGLPVFQARQSRAYYELDFEKIA